MVRLALLAAVTAFSAMAADVTVFRLEEDRRTGDTRVVGVDGVRRSVKLVDPSEYAALTTAFYKVWAAMNSDESGRRKIHGKVVGKPVIDDNGKHTTYADGYVHTEETVRQNVRPDLAKRKFVTTKSTYQAPKRPANMPERLWKIRSEADKVRNGKVREVRVDYDADRGVYVDKGEVK